jgi:hypothetical protein
MHGLESPIEVSEASFIYKNIFNVDLTVTKPGKLYQVQWLIPITQLLARQRSEDQVFRLTWAKS